MDWSELKSFMDLAKRHPLLTREEEWELSGAYAAGVKAAGDLKSKDLTADERRALKLLVYEGELARERFLNGNLRLVVSIAKRYRHETYSLADLVQEGNIGLMRALEKFDRDRGFKFSTYASWWIRQAMTRALHQADMIRIPVYKVEVRNRVRKVLFDAGLHSEGDLDDEVVADRAGVSVKEVRLARTMPYVGSSLDEVLTENGSPVGENIPDEDAENAELAAIFHDIQEKFDDLFVGFSERDMTILRMRFGEDCSSLEEIGDVVGLTRERVRQILMNHKKILKDRADKLGML
jgi:RNA polymerase sigma factor (sigma-70 family)